MSYKVMVTTEEQKNAFADFAKVIEHVINLGNDIDDLSDKEVDNFTEVFRNLEFSNSVSGTLDTALLGEIGKAYKEQHSIAKETGNTKVEERMFGAMHAVKRIMDMVDDPTI